MRNLIFYLFLFSLKLSEGAAVCDVYYWLGEKRMLPVGAA